MKFTNQLCHKAVENIMYPYSFAMVTESSEYAVLYNNPDSAIMNLVNRFPIKDVKEGKTDKHPANVEEVRLKLSQVSEFLNKNVFIVSEGASITRNSGSVKVKRAREIQVAWEKDNNADPNEDWG